MNVRAIALLCSIAALLTLPALATTRATDLRDGDGAPTETSFERHARTLLQSKCDKCNIPVNQGGCKCNANCDCLQGGNKCDKCNLSVEMGGCKCDKNCNCLQTGNKCDKCNLSVERGGCKCDKNCDCLQTGNKCDKCNLSVERGGCKCDKNCDCLQTGSTGSSATMTGYDIMTTDNTCVGCLAGGQTVTRAFVNAVNVVAVHSKDWEAYKYREVDITYNGKTATFQVWDYCSDSDCNGCCTSNMRPNNFLVDVDATAAKRMWGISNAASSLKTTVKFRKRSNAQVDYRGICRKYGGRNC